MSESAADPHPPTANQLAERRTNLAARRTSLADERTLMAWLRTSLSMISFGFTIYKFLQDLAKLENSRVPDNGPRNLGLALVGLGTAALIVASFQHWSRVSDLGSHYSRRTQIPLVLLISIAISLLGILVFFSIVLQVGPF